MDVSFSDLLLYKNNQMLFKIKHTLFIIFMAFLVAACQTRPVTSMDKSQQVKEKADKKQQEKLQKEQEKARKKHYEMQSVSTKELMDYNKRASEQWMEKNYKKKPFFEQVKDFFRKLKPNPKPDKGLVSKKLKRKSKKNIFQRIFKKKK
ncbi:MAG: hypothetical protein ACLFVR_06130 [Thiohalospira sp.]